MRSSDRVFCDFAHTLFQALDSAELRLGSTKFRAHPALGLVLLAWARTQGCYCDPARAYQ